MAVTMMTRLPNDIDASGWIQNDARGYFAFARLLAGRTAHYQITGKRIPVHRAETEVTVGLEDLFAEREDA